MKSNTPAPTIVPTNPAVSRGIPVVFSILVISVGTRLTVMMTAMIEDTNPVTYSLTFTAITFISLKRYKNQVL